MVTVRPLRGALSYLRLLLSMHDSDGAEHATQCVRAGWRRKRCVLYCGYTTQNYFGWWLQGGPSLTPVCLLRSNNAVIPVPIMAKVDTSGYNLFNLVKKQEEKSMVVQSKHIMGIVNDSHARVSKQSGYNNSPEEVNLLTKILENITIDVSKTTQTLKPAGLTTNADLWDDTARYAKKEIQDKPLTFEHKDEIVSITYRFGINIIVPTKVKVEHSKKTVRRFALDFSEILLPMHIDLIVKMEGKEFVWTIHEFETNKHQVFHTGYDSNDSRLFDMTDTIEEMIAKHREEEYDSKFFEKPRWIQHA